jgi:hypothetical protein
MEPASSWNVRQRLDDARRQGDRYAFAALPSAALSSSALRAADAYLLCPIAPTFNSRHELAEEAAWQWLSEHELLPDRAALDHFASYRITELVSRAYPDAELESLRLVMDWTLWVFMTDDELDAQPGDLAKLRDRYEMYGRVLLGEQNAASLPGRYRALADIRARILRLAGASCLRRFSEHVSAWFDALVWEAENRLRGVRPTVHQYIRLREVTVGTYPEYALFDASHRFQTDEVFWTDPDLLYLMASTAKLIGWANDIFSYAKETRLEDPHNLPHLLEVQCGFDHAGAVLRVVEMYNKEMLRFLESEQQLRARATDGLHVEAFVGMLRAWIRANLEWSQASTRYALDVEPPPVGFSGRESTSRT